MSVAFIIFIVAKLYAFPCSFSPFISLARSSSTSHILGWWWRHWCCERAVRRAELALSYTFFVLCSSSIIQATRLFLLLLTLPLLARSLLSSTGAEKSATIARVMASKLLLFFGVLASTLDKSPELCATID
jgi:heme/copper-type cytochrome/quinol oxidase subunit 3